MKIKIVQDTLVFISAITKTQLEKAQRLCPNAVTLYDEETPIFRFGYTVCGGSVNNNGIIFDSFTEDDYACVTVLKGPQKADTQDMLEEFAPIVLKANALEAQIKDALSKTEQRLNDAGQFIEVVKL